MSIWSPIVRSSLVRYFPSILSSRLINMSSSGGNGDQKPRIQVDKKQLKEELTPLQYEVTQEQGTEAPWTGDYLSLKDNGM